MSPEPKRLPTFGQLYSLQLLSQLPMGVMLSAFISETFGNLGARDLTVAYITAGMAVSAFVQGVLVARLSGTYRALEAELALGTPLDAMNREQLLFALRPYRLGSLVTLLLWVVPLACYPFMLRASGISLSSWTLGMTLLAGLSISLGQAVVSYYVFYLVVFLRISPVLLSGGSLVPLGPFQPVFVWQHLAAVSVMLGIILPTGYAALSSVAPGWVATAFAAAMVFYCGFIQVTVVQLAISRPLGNLLGRMEDVSAGNLDTRAGLRALDTLGVLASHFNSMVDGLKQREFMRETFGRYVAREVADHILAGRVALGGETRTATVLFSDIRGFTRMSEEMSPAEVVAFLNEYLGLMVGCVTEHHGMLDKFIGDAVMAVFGVPVTQGTPQQDAESAVACALAMDGRLTAFNATRAARGQPPIEIGIGIHTGELVAGNIGSPERMQYTVIGDTVNLTSRLEGMTKTVGRRILISDTTAGLLSNRFALEPLETMPVRGRARPVQVFAVKAAA